MENKNNPNRLSRSKETLERLRLANIRLGNTSRSPLFRQLAETQGVDTEHPDHSNIAYWDLLAGFREAEISTNPDQSESPQLDVIAAYTPAAMLHSRALQRRTLPKNELREHKRFLSRYNQLVRDLGESRPETSASGLIAGLTETAYGTVANSSHELRQVTGANIPAVVRGAQHELGFAQIIDAVGFQREPASIEDDLAGADLFVHLPGDYGRVAIDVKSSLDQIDRKNHGNNGSPFNIESTGKITMFSCITDQDFHDSFRISSAVAEDRSPIVLAALFKAGQRIKSLRTTPRRH